MDERLQARLEDADRKGFLPHPLSDYAEHGDYAFLPIEMGHEGNCAAIQTRSLHDCTCNPWMFMPARQGGLWVNPGDAWVWAPTGQVALALLSGGASPDAQPASPSPDPASSPAPGPWTRSDLDEWRCPKCGRMTYTPKSDRALMAQCPECPGLVWMERLLEVAA